SWLDPESGCRSAARYQNKTDFRMSDIGFRVALVAIRTEAPANPVPPQRSSASDPFVVVAAPTKKEVQHATLAAAVAASQTGDITEIRHDGPFVLPPIDLKSKALILRAGKGCRPVLRLAAEAEQANLALLKTRAPLTLEGLEFQREGHAKHAVGVAHIRSQN